MIKVLFFGSIADRLEKRDCLLPAHENMTVANVVEAVGSKGFQPLLLAVNQKQVNDMNLIVKDGDEVAFMPPFSGG